jgi:hypothetical protein
MAKQVLILAARREGYGIDQVRRTMTVGDLVAYLQENYEEDVEIYLSHDNGYTYGGIREEYFHEDVQGPEEENEEEEEY